ncbi:nitrate reductase molybdenum cofactor assembly chaperone [Rhodoferax sp.]|uniref:nitrate reductase molybdenum cofactor assembly chaperone n=1 Tax=Rhodoferax sp. TaxID=50421 RepID=UPI0025D11952|nr:nitrate reductase molybdenum cofactor assembly chaperone [Rhodoferax sp.]
MGFLGNTPPVATKTLRVLARLLSYPDPTLRRHLPELRQALRDESALSAARLAELEDLMTWMTGNGGNDDALSVEESYVDLFDRGRATSLHLFEHVHGDSRDRGPAMIDLAQTFEKANLYLAPGEMPDYLPVVLEYTSTQPPKDAQSFLNEMAHIFNAIFAALQQRDTRYASVLGALLELAGEKAKPVKVTPDEAIDDSWEEPNAFDGCSTKGQANPNQPQPIHIVRKSTANTPQPGVTV